MNKTILLLCGLLCVVVVSARNYRDRADVEDTVDNEDQNEFRKQRQHSNIERHRRRRWQSNYGYDYDPPRYYQNRRDYNNNQDLIPQIFKLLDDIAAQVRRQPPPPPPPQPIYIPYPVPYYVPQYSPCTPNVTKKPNVTGRFPEMEDTNQNWGFVVPPNEIDYDDGTDGSRPISFDPVMPKQKYNRPAPPVEHGSSQGEMTTAAPKFAEPKSTLSESFPSMCHAAVLSCCGYSQSEQKKCFTNIGCGKTYAKGNACTTEAINEALETFKASYAPVN